VSGETTPVGGPAPTPSAHKRRVLLVNAALRAITEIVGKIASLALIAVIGHQLGETVLGQYLAVLAGVQIMWTAGDFGMFRYLLREVARDHRFMDRAFYDVVGIKIVVLGGLVLLSAAVSFVIGGFSTTTSLLLLLGASKVADLVATVPVSVFMAHERMAHFTYAEIPNKYLQAGLGIAAVFAGGGIVEVSVAVLLSSLAGTAISIYLMLRHYSRPRLRITPRTWPALVRRSGWFGVQDVLAHVIMRVDVVLLSLLATGAAVGWYGAAYRFMDATMFITASLAASATPMYTNLSLTSTPSLRDVYGDSMRLIFLLLTPISVGLLFGADTIIDKVFGSDFGPSVVVLQLLAFAPLFYALSFQAATLVVSRDFETRVVRWFAAGAVLNIVLNLIFIPLWSYKAAATITLATEITLAAACLVEAHRVVPRLGWVPLLLSPAVGAAGMLVVFQLVGTGVGALLVSGVVYLLLVAFLEVKVFGHRLRPLKADTAASDDLRTA
jgi:O-antigen/teichoic acid export membrane protein